MAAMQTTPKKRVRESDTSDEEWGSSRKKIAKYSESCFSPLTRKSKQQTPSKSLMTPSTEPLTPLPFVAWGDRSEIWKHMLIEDEQAAKKRDFAALEFHSTLSPRMRTILLDWLSEVCEVYRLHRETYFLAVDYLDRYLSSTRELPKTQLQLLGITCLFIAAKVEEIYPPKINEFAYVTDGACTDREILLMEIVVIRELNWDFTPITIHYWLCTYLQILNKKRTLREDNLNVDKTFVYPQYSVLEYERAVTLCTLATWDIGVLGFSYATIAASSLYYVINRESALTVSSLPWDDIEPCVNWLHPFASVLRGNCRLTIRREALKSPPQCRTGLLKYIPDIQIDQLHILQTHSVDIELFHLAKSLPPLTPVKKKNDSPSKNAILTPPTSASKKIYA